MSNVIIDKNKIDLLANAIAAKSGESLPLTLAEMVEAVDGIQGGGGITPTGNINITQSGVTDVTAYATATVPEADAEVGHISPVYIDLNGRKWQFSYNAFVNSAGWLDVGAIGVGADYVYTYPAIHNLTVTPTESAQTIGGADYMLEDAITVSAIPSNYVGSGVTQRTSSDLTASGATVTAPAGYYASNATKSVASGTATPAATISATSATLSTGTNTLTLSKTVSNTPQVSAGYVSSGTAGNSSVSLTASVTTQAAQTIYPSTSDQSIAASRYLTGAQTIKGVTTSNLTADNIKSGVTVTVGDSANASRIASILGTYTGGGGGGGIGTLLTTYNMGTISTSSTQAADTGKSISVSPVNDYDLLIVETSVNTVTNNRHTATVGLIFLTASSTVETKNGATIATVKWNSRISSSAVTTTRAGTTAYGIYPNSCTVATSNSVTTATIPMYQRYNSTSTGTINGAYTTRVYGVNLYDLIGG